ncbi:MAG: CoA pyrophosphatase [Chloroflexi bacterium]|nr:CoA pyrophosphatase [Chloroflexota bacterium]
MFPDAPASSYTQIRESISRNTPTLLPLSSLRPAAVLVGLAGDEEGCRVVLTVRSSRVEHHKGEVSFPGGSVEPRDPTLEATALRESYEEVGILPAHVTILGRLSDQETRSGFRISPFVGYLPYPYVYKPNPREVTEVLEVPLRHLEDLQNVSQAGRTHQALRAGESNYHFGGHLIFGATARILTELLQILTRTSTL